MTTPQVNQSLLSLSSPQNDSNNFDSTIGQNTSNKLNTHNYHLHGDSIYGYYGYCGYSV